MTRAAILKKAEVCVCGQREQDYGTPENNFARIANLWNAYMGDDFFEPQDVAMMMALLKIARIKTGSGTADSFIDLAGYAACGGEIATSMYEAADEQEVEATFYANDQPVETLTQETVDQWFAEPRKTYL